MYRFSSIISKVLGLTCDKGSEEDGLPGAKIL